MRAMKDITGISHANSFSSPTSATLTMQSDRYLPDYAPQIEKVLYSLTRCKNKGLKLKKMILNSNFEYQKFKQVVHFFIDQTSTLDNVGKKVLYKLLYFTEFNYYELFEEKLTGEAYAKLEHGPAPRHFSDVIKELKGEGKIIEKKAQYYDHPQIRYFSLKRPSLSLLNADELNFLEDSLCRYGSMNGSQIEALSHKDIPWIIASNKKNLDYEMVFYRDPDMSVREYSDG